MQYQLGFFCLLALGASANNLEVTPTAKVVTLLQGMLEKGKAAKHAEQVSFAASQQFCGDQSAVTESAIKDERLVIGTLGAQIGQDTANIARLGREIGALNADENTWSGDITASKGVRLIEYTDYETTHKDYTEAIDAIGRAIAVLKKQTHDRSQAASFAQLSDLTGLSLIPDTAKRAIDAFVQADAVSDVIAAPEANGYEFQANGVIDMLQKLQSKFIDEKTTLEKEEATAKHAFELLQQSLTTQVKQAETTEERKVGGKGTYLESKALESSDRDETVSLESVDEKFLKNLKADCAMTASDFTARQQLRSDELVAIEQAITILSGDAVAGAAIKHLPSLLQKKATSMSQLRFTSNSQIQSRLATFLHERAATLNSVVLEAVAVRAGADPFNKVKKMIKDLVVRLMEEANEESTHKGFCDTELSTNKQTREEKTSAVSTLTADIELLKASIAKISADVATLTQANSDLSTAMSSATTIRNTEKTENAATISDAQDAQTALAQALTVLKEFYAKAAEATSFAQTLAPYNGMAAENGGVVGMLEVVQADFARLESETKASEATGQREYDSFMTTSKVDKASKDTAIEHKTAKSQDATQKLTEKKTDLEGNQKELDAALTYYDKLKPSCVDSGSTYEDRVARRKEEVESLQEALRVMNGEDIALVQ